MADAARADFATAGSVDDGKSTLIGRLLYDSKSIFEDQLEAVEHSSASGRETPNLALLTDGLRAEREQGITIDVAYRYFATPRRKFIIADTPGHLQYTRNMVTGRVHRRPRDRAGRRPQRACRAVAAPRVPRGAARHPAPGAVPSTRWTSSTVDQARFDEIARRVRRLRRPARACRPRSWPSRLGAERRQRGRPRRRHMPWYEGRPCSTTSRGRASHRTATLHRRPLPGAVRAPAPDRRVPRLPRLRRHGGRRRAAPRRRGRRAAVGRAHDGRGIDRRRPSRRRASQAVSVRLADDLDVSRGDMIAAAADPPPVRRELEATLCWFNENEALKAGETYLLKHTTRTVKARVEAVVYRVDVESLATDEADAARAERDRSRAAAHSATRSSPTRTRRTGRRAASC